MTTTPSPGSLEAVKGTRAGIDRYKAAVEYVKRAEDAAKDGRTVRDEEVRRLVAQHGPAHTRELTGLSLALVKSIARGVTRR